MTDKLCIRSYRSMGSGSMDQSLLEVQINCIHIPAGFEFINIHSASNQSRCPEDLKRKRENTNK